jgi:hypothetical protein
VDYVNLADKLIHSLNVCLGALHHRTQRMIPARALLQQAHHRRHVRHASAFVLREMDLTIDFANEEETRDRQRYQEEGGEEGELRGIS